MVSSMALKLACVVLMCMFAGALAHGQVAANLMPCLSSLGGAAPSTACCNALNSTVAQASTTASRQELCSCLTLTIIGKKTLLA
ncbi:hypothetical protein Tsubulata_002447 [Turnera subulata]|uniref:Bifunctional inhibitor/plant lipid transfer protein/seed storage helical domain-containing protein n=1 Tax=Turnera subulata TaxID=218843 RepID=A0A9Q0F8W4_9ROSI|nr:hypothetical protein Tsubulata_002447 [Turnera subulata]